jgi:hypothetical protein
MATTIVTKNGSGVPLDTDLVQGELAIDLENKRIYSKDPNDEIVQLGSDIDIPDGVEDDDMLLWSNTDDKWTTSEYVPSTEFSTSPPVNPKTGMLWQDTTPDEQALYCWDGSAWFEIVGANGHDGGDAKQIWSEVTDDGDIYYSKGNVGIGAAPSSLDAGQISLEAQGRIRVGRDGATTLQLNRANSNGDIATFYKDGAQKGSIMVGDYSLGFSGGSASQEALTIAADGRVGIGQPNPTFSVDILSADNSQLRLDSTSTANTSILMDYNQGGATNRVRIMNTAGDLAFATNNNQTKMTITPAGNVGIGTDDPSTKLNVVGDATNYGILATQPSGYAGLSVKSTTVNQTWSFVATDNGANSDLLLYGGSSAGTKLTVDHAGNTTFTGNVTTSDVISTNVGGSSAAGTSFSGKFILPTMSGNTIDNSVWLGRVGVNGLVDYRFLHAFFSGTVTANTFDGNVVRSSHVIQDGAPVVDSLQIIRAFMKLRDAVEDTDSSVEQLREKLKVAVVDIIDQFQEQLDNMDDIDTPVVMPAEDSE